MILKGISCIEIMYRYLLKTSYQIEQAKEKIYDKTLILQVVTYKYHSISVDQAS